MSQIETQNTNMEKKSHVWQREHETQTGLWAPYLIHIETFKYMWKCTTVPSAAVQKGTQNKNQNQMKRKT